MDHLSGNDDTAVYGDKGYVSDAKKRAAEVAGVLWAVKEKARPGGRLTPRQRARNHRFGKVRAKVEHVFRVVKCQFGYRKVRYRGIAKNGAQVFSLLALANLYLALRTLASTRPSAPACRCELAALTRKNVPLSRKRSHRRVDQSFPKYSAFHQMPTLERAWQSTCGKSRVQVGHLALSRSPVAASRASLTICAWSKVVNLPARRRMRPSTMT